LENQSQKTKDIGKYSFVNRSITVWNKLLEGAIGFYNGKKRIFKTRLSNVKTSDWK